MTTTPYKKLTYDDTKVQVESAIRDEDGVRIKTNYAKKNEIKDGTLTINTQGGTTLGTFSANQPTDTPVTITLPNGTVQLLNQTVTFDIYTPTQTEIDEGTYAEFPYRATVSVTGVTASTYAIVTYSEEQATSLNFATSCDTATDTIYLYSRTNVGTVTIPTISIGMDYSDITIDATPTSGSGNAVSSGGVYTALNDGSVSKIGTADVGSDRYPVKMVGGVPQQVGYELVTTGNMNQIIDGVKTFKFSSGNPSYLIIQRGGGDSSTALTNATLTLKTNTGDRGRVNNWEDANTVNTQLVAVGNSEQYLQVTSAKNSSGGWVIAPYRTYNSSNASDVVTIGTLNSEGILMKGISLKGIGGVGASSYGSNPSTYQSYISSSTGSVHVQLLLQAQTDGHAAIWALRNNSWSDAIRLAYW